MDKPDGFFNDLVHLLSESRTSLRVLAPWITNPADGAELSRLIFSDTGKAARWLAEKFPQKTYNWQGDPLVFFRCGYGIPASVGVEWAREVFAEDQGVNLRQYNFFAPLPSLVRRLVDKIEESVESHDRRVILVGHSMGGLTSLGASKVVPDLIEKVITFATPVRGAKGARWFKYLTQSLYELREDKVRELKLYELPEGEKAPQYFNICLSDDGIVRPFENSLLPEQVNTTNFVVPGIRHNESLYHPIVRRVVYLRLHNVHFDTGYEHQLKYGLAHTHHGLVDRVLDANKRLFV
ncbi:hypothetical protein COV17_02990 [Candidatus Woesearchaeota archaeon CG10_big_fil_rev_8_21_14_0_10_36_11]|nr:MAG: hypothetical protein COV17_02990 [Candidatus Woesearchaeota archaeon CG10_big_fil_rev_8_21_14_0_10_36_11]